MLVANTVEFRWAWSNGHCCLFRYHCYSAKLTCESRSVFYLCVCALGDSLSAYFSKLFVVK